MFAIFLVAGVPWRPLLAAGIIAVGVGLVAIWAEPYRRARVFSFLDPWSDAEGSGFQIVQALIGFGSGGVTGEGLGESVSKVLYLPEAHTDMIFAVIGEELGLVGSTLVIARLRRVRVRGVPDRAAQQGPVREAPRGRAHRARLRAGVGQPRGRARHRAADRDPAAVRLVRRVEPRRAARRRRDTP